MNLSEAQLLENRKKKIKFQILIPVYTFQILDLYQNQILTKELTLY